MTLFRDRGVVLRTTSKFGSRLEPLSHVALLGWQGRGDLDTINQVEVIDTFRPVREDLDRMSAAMSMLEVVDQIGQERHANPGLYGMLVGAMVALAQHNSPMVAPAFFLKVLALEGSAPFLDGCVSCGQEDLDQLVAFDLVEGGVLCRNCRRGRPLSGDGLVLLQRTLGGGLAGVLAEPRSPVTDEVTALATEAMEAHLDRRLRSVHSGPVS
jgi:DNA repair protein RecO (recombination protein O)